MIFVSRKRFKWYENELIKVTHENSELRKENEKLKREIEIVNEDNQLLRDVNDFYLKKYNDAKDMIRTLTNKDPNNSNIPYKCRECGDILNYNENLHIATCTQCKTTYR